MRAHCGASVSWSLFELEGQSSRLSRSPWPCEATALREDDLFLPMLCRGPAPGFRKVRPEIECRVFFSCHRSTPHVSRELSRAPVACLPCLNLAQGLERSQRGERLRGS